MLAAFTDFLWGQLLIVALIGLGLWFCLATRLVQFRFFGRMFRRRPRQAMPPHQGQRPL